MTLFQWFALPLFIGSAVVSLILSLRGTVRRRAGILWSLLWLLAAVAVFRPDLTTRLGNLFGIGRGVDFIIYLNLIAGFYVTLSLYARSRRLETIVTELVRQQALSTPERSGPPQNPVPETDPKTGRSAEPAAPRETDIPGAGSPTPR